MTNSFLKSNLTLLLILFLALLLRLWGITYDLPLSSSVGDEVNFLAGGLKILGEGKFILQSEHVIYFPLMYYIYAIAIAFYSAGLFIFGQVSSLIELKYSAIINLGEWLIVGRVLSVVMGTFSVYFIYFISNKIFNNRFTAYLAALLMAISPLSVALSHFGKTWTPQIFFILLSFYIFLRLWQNRKEPPSFWTVFWSGLLVVVSFSVNLVGLLAYPVLLLVILYYYLQFDWKKIKSFLFGRESFLLHVVLAVGITSVLLVSGSAYNFYIDLYNTFFSSNFGSNVKQIDAIWQISWFNRVGLYLDILMQFETVLFLLLIPSFWFLYKKNKKLFLFLFLLFLGFFISLGPPIMHSTRPRYLSLLVPFMVLPAANFMSYAIGRIKIKRFVLAGLIILLLLAPSLFIDFKYNYLLTKNSTKLDLYNWIIDNLKPGEKILLVGYYLMQDIVPDQDLIKLVKEYSPGYYSTRSRYISEARVRGDSLISYGIYSDSFVCQWPKEIVDKLEFDYIAIVETSKGNAYDPINFYNFQFLNICDNIPVYRLTEKQLIFSKDNDPYFNYSIESANPLESYIPLWQIKQFGKPVNIYRLK